MFYIKDEWWPKEELLAKDVKLNCSITLVSYLKIGNIFLML